MATEPIIFKMETNMLALGTTPKCTEKEHISSRMEHDLMVSIVLVIDTAKAFFTFKKMSSKRAAGSWALNRPQNPSQIILLANTKNSKYNMTLNKSSHFYIEN